jgi:exosortase sorting signal-containing protein
MSMDIFRRVQIRTIVFSIFVLVAAVSISTETKAQVWSADVPPPVFVEQFTQVLWDQTGNVEGTAVTSQNFTDAGGAFDTFDNRAADDFEVPDAAGWSINTVRAVGTYNVTPGPIQSLNVVFFTDSGGLPGSVIPGCNYQSILPTNNDNPDFIINLPEPCTLLSGVYWVSVQANMPFLPNGQWFWFTENVQTLNLYAWENPLNGTGNGCPTWTAGIICIPAGGPDLTFQLIGEPFVTPRPVPTLSQWGLIATAGVLGLLGVIFMRRRGLKDA